MDDLFQISTDSNDGWMLCFGRDQDGKDYSIITNNVHASEAGFILRGAKLDAELVLKILNENYERYLDEAES